MKPKEVLANERAEILLATTNLLDRIAVKLDCSPVGVALDTEFLEAVCLYLEAVSEHLRSFDRDTIPPPQSGDVWDLEVPCPACGSVHASGVHCGTVRP